MAEVKMTLNIAESDLDESEIDVFTRRLQNELMDMDEVDKAAPVRTDEAPAGSKAVGDTVLGALKVVFDAGNIGSLFKYLGERVGSKKLELEIEANGKKLKLKAGDADEVRKILKAAQAFAAAD